MKIYFQRAVNSIHCKMHNIGEQLYASSIVFGSLRARIATPRKTIPCAVLVHIPYPVGLCTRTANGMVLRGVAMRARSDPKTMEEALNNFYVRSNLTEAQFCVNGIRRITQSRHFPEKSYLAVFPRLLLPPLRFPEIIHRRERHHCFNYTVQ